MARIMAVVLALLLLWPGEAGAPIVQTPAKPQPEPGARISGPARVVDGDTLVVWKIRIRLLALDAPERGQMCEAPNGRRFDCGELASEHMQALVGEWVECFARAQDVYGRLLADCHSSISDDLQYDMVVAGYAQAMGKRYREAEAVARDNGLGLTRFRMLEGN